MFTKILFQYVYGRRSFPGMPLKTWPNYKNIEKTRTKQTHATDT